MSKRTEELSYKKEKEKTARRFKILAHGKILTNGSLTSIIKILINYLMIYIIEQAQLQLF